MCGSRPAPTGCTGLSDGSVTPVPLGRSLRRSDQGALERVSEKARANTSGRFAAKAMEAMEGGGRRFVDAPPVLSRVDDAEATAVAATLEHYLTTLSEDRHALLNQRQEEGWWRYEVGCGTDEWWNA